MTARYFTPEEFKCKCGRPDCNAVEPHPKLVGMLDIARGYAGLPFVISSGSRCTLHNWTVGGSSDSSHLPGYASDIRCLYGLTRLKIIEALLFVGFRRIGIAKTFIHGDIDFNKPDSIWVY